MDQAPLLLAAFISSALSAVLGVGGGTLLIAVMALFLPPVAVVPVHGVAQLASNASRALFSLHSVQWRIVLPFSLGCLAGAAAGMPLVAAFPAEWLPLLLGLFILLVTWLPPLTWRVPLPGGFAWLGGVQGLLTLLVGATGPLNLPFLVRAGLSRDRIVATAAVLMTVVHALKLAAFGLLGFLFAPWFGLVAALVLAVVAGSWAGTKLRPLVPEGTFRTAFKLLVTLLALKLLLKPLLA